VEQRSFNNSSALGAGQSDIDLSVDIPPFWRCSQANDEFFEVGAMLRRILEPRQEVEGLAKFPAVMEPPRYRGEIFDADRDVTGLFLEDGAALILLERPPRVGLADRDQGSLRSGWPIEAFLTSRHCFGLFVAGVSRVARASTECPGLDPVCKGVAPFDYLQASCWWEALSNDGLHAINDPAARISGSEGD